MIETRGGLSYNQVAMNERAGLEERVARIEGILSQMDKRLNHVETEIVGLRGEINSLRGEITGLRGEINGRFARLEGEIRTNFRWIIGLMLTMWVTIILAIIFRV